MRITVTLAKNGDYWQARWKRGGTGKRQCKGLGRRRDAGGTVSARQAERLRRQLEADLNHGKVMDGPAPTIQAHIARYLKNSTGYADGTRGLYVQTGAMLQAYLGDDTRMDRVSVEDAEDWEGAVARGELTEGRIPAVATVRGHVRRAKRLFGTAGLPSNPFAGLTGRAPKATKDWESVTMAGLDKLLDACPSHGWRCLFALARLAGLRRGEALRLRWQDVDLVGRRLSVVPDVAYETTKKRTRQVPIQPKLYDTLWTAWNASDGNEWVAAGDGVPKEAASLWKASVRIIQRAGLKPWKKPFHTLRKNLETEWMREYPMPVLTEWLGHAPEVAMEHYTRAEDEDFAKAAGLSSSAEVTQSLPQSPSTSRPAGVRR